MCCTASLVVDCWLALAVPLVLLDSCERGSGIERTTERAVEAWVVVVVEVVEVVLGTWGCCCDGSCSLKRHCFC